MFPFKREVKDLNLILNKKISVSKTFSPNFYSESLCQKSNLSHGRKKKGGRKKSHDEIIFEENIQGDSDAVKISSNINVDAEPIIVQVAQGCESIEELNDESSDDSNEEDNEEIEVNISTIEPNNLSSSGQLNAAKRPFGGKRPLNIAPLNPTFFENKVGTDQPSAFLDYWKDTLTPLFFYSKPSPSPKLFTAKSTSDYLLNDSIFNSRRESFAARRSSYSARKMSFINSLTQTQNFIPKHDLMNENLYFHNDAAPIEVGQAFDTNLISNLKKRKSLMAPPPIPVVAIFDEDYAWSLFETKDFVKLREYLETNPIVGLFII